MNHYTIFLNHLHRILQIKRTKVSQSHSISLKSSWLLKALFQEGMHVRVHVESTPQSQTAKLLQSIKESTYV